MRDETLIAGIFLTVIIAVVGGLIYSSGHEHELILQCARKCEPSGYVFDRKTEQIRCTCESKNGQ